MLDTETGSPAELVYPRLGYIQVCGWRPRERAEERSADVRVNWQVCRSGLFPTLESRPTEGLWREIPYSIRICWRKRIVTEVMCCLGWNSWEGEGQSGQSRTLSSRFARELSEELRSQSRFHKSRLYASADIKIRYIPCELCFIPHRRSSQIFAFQRLLSCETLWERLQTVQLPQ